MGTVYCGIEIALVSIVKQSDPTLHLKRNHVFIHFYYEVAHVRIGRRKVFDLIPISGTYCLYPFFIEERDFVVIFYRYLTFSLYFKVLRSLYFSSNDKFRHNTPAAGCCPPRNRFVFYLDFLQGHR